MTTIPLQDQPKPQGVGWGGIDTRLDVVATRAPEASRKDSHPQAILKLLPHNSFNYRVTYKLQPKNLNGKQLKF